MTTDDTNDEALAQLAEYLRLNPDATTPEVLGATDADPSVWGDAVDDALASDEPHLALETPDTGAVEGDSRGVNPTLEGGKPASTTPETSGTDGSALVDALEWFHQQLDRDLPDECDHDTPRDYYREGRGWDDDTIDEKLLGFAPANYRDELVTYLFDRGHDREAILSTGLFGERDDGNLYTTWSGRYVLPYFDGEGRPVFAISRATDPVHSADWKGNKYDKLQVTRDDVTAEEPIYGLDTVRDGEPVLITEGIADAITAHEAGYPCISPVTTQFKTSDREDLLEALGERDVGRAYLIQDAERPTSDVDDRDRLTLQQFGDGVKGAVKTAAYLDDHGLEARVAELPRPGLAKVDLDDYLQGWSDDLTPLLAGAKPVDQHPAYDPDTARDVALDAAEASDLGTVDTDGDHSALFDLGIRDVTGLSWDYRGANPLGHHGESENYFVLLEGHGVAYDHKYKAAYNALTYLLVDAGERRPISPNGRLEDAEVFAAWRHAKREGCIPDDDPIPLDALQHVAREATDWDGNLVEQTTADGDTFDGLPSDVYNDALEGVREEYDLDPGRHSVGERAGDDAEPTAVLPPAVRDLSTAASGWDWKHAGRRDPDDDPMQVARDRTTEEIVDALESFDHALVEAIPTLGKSYGGTAAVDETGEPATILTGRGNVEQYDQYKQWADEFDLDVYTLPSFTRDCPTANGEHGEEWKETVRDWYRRGATPQEIHAHAEHHLGEPLPCQRHEGQECPYSSAWRFDPDDYDILLGHYSHAYNESEKVTVDRAVIIDEFPGDAYERALGSGSLKSAVTHYLQGRDAVPFDDYTELLEHRDDDARRADALAALIDGDLEADTGAVFQDSTAHADAPLAVFTILAAAGSGLGNGLERAPFPDDDDRVGVFDREGDVLTRDDQADVRVLDPPPLDYARSVVALDGTPTPEMWELALGADGPRPLGDRMTHRQVLTEPERREYIRDHLNLNVVRTTEYLKPYNSADHVDIDGDMALLDAVRDRHGQKPGLITPQTALDEYEQAGVLEYDHDTGEVLDGPADRVRWRGNVLGSNEFADTRVGAVIGSNHFGDGFIKKWGAYAGEPVERGAVDDDAPAKGENLTYGEFGDRVHRHMTEHDTLQAVMRFGRDGNGAVVYCHTDTLPEWLPLAGEGRIVDIWSDGMRAVVDVLEDLGEATTAAVADHPAVDLSRQQVFDHLETLRSRGVLQRQQDAEDGRRVVWRDDGLHRLGEHGNVELEAVDLEDLDDEEVRQLARNSIYTWEFTNLASKDAGSTVDLSRATSDPSLALVNGGDGPPDNAD